MRLPFAPATRVGGYVDFGSQDCILGYFVFSMREERRRIECPKSKLCTIRLGRHGRQYSSVFPGYLVKACGKGTNHFASRFNTRMGRSQFRHGHSLDY